MAVPPDAHNCTSCGQRHPQDVEICTPHIKLSIQDSAVSISTVRSILLEISTENCSPEMKLQSRRKLIKPAINFARVGVCLADLSDLDSRVFPIYQGFGYILCMRNGSEIDSVDSSDSSSWSVKSYGAPCVSSSIVDASLCTLSTAQYSIRSLKWDPSRSSNRPPIPQSKLRRRVGCEGA